MVTDRSWPVRKKTRNDNEEYLARRKDEFEMLLNKCMATKLKPTYLLIATVAGNLEWSRSGLPASLCDTPLDRLEVQNTGVKEIIHI
jgi:hypothetical protein